MSKHPRVVEGAFERGMLTRIVDKFTAWRQRRAAARYLHGLPDRLLEDIGVNRFDIDAMVNQPIGRTAIAVKKFRDVPDTADIRRAA